MIPAEPTLEVASIRTRRNLPWLQAEVAWPDSSSVLQTGPPPVNHCHHWRSQTRTLEFLKNGARLSILPLNNSAFHHLLTGTSRRQTSTTEPMTQLMEEEIDGGPLVPLQTSLFLDVNRCDGTALIFTEGPVFNVFDNLVAPHRSYFLRISLFSRCFSTVCSFMVIINLVASSVEPLIPDICGGTFQNKRSDYHSSGELQLS